MKKAKVADSLLILQIEGFNYGLYESDINDIISGLRKLHKLPYFPKRVAGMSAIEVENKDASEEKGGAGDREDSVSAARTGTFFDLGFCLGHKKFNADKGGCLFTIGSRSVKKPLEGFAAPSPPEIIEIDKKELLLIPKVMKQAQLLGCIVTGKGLVPVIDIKSLYKDVKEKDWTLPTFHISTENLKEKKSDSHKVFSLPSISDDEDSDYAISESFIGKGELKVDSTCKVKFAPPHVECFAVVKGELIVVLNMGPLAGAGKVSLDGGVIFSINAIGLGLLVGADKGGAKSQVKEVFDLAATNIINSVIVKDKKIVPILNLRELLSGGDSGIKTEKQVYKSRVNEFSSSFGKDEQSLLQFTIRGIKQAIPRNEEDDSFPLKQWRPIEGLPQIILGVVEHKGEVLPVLDPSVCFGLRTEKPSEKMVLLKKDGFKAFIITEDKPVAITVTPANQKNLPMAMDKDYVYGCYVEGDSVGLVLNMEALVRDFDEEEFKEFFGTVADEMDIEREAAGEVIEEEEVEEAEAEVLEVIEEEFEPELAIESGEEFSDNLKIDASVFEGVVGGDRNDEFIENNEEKPNIKEEFLKYQKSLENQEAKDSAEDEGKSSKEESDYLEYEEEDSDDSSKREDEVLDEKVEVVEENDGSDSENHGVHSFSTRSSEVETAAPDSRESRDVGGENKRLLLILAGAVIVLTMSLMFFISTGEDKEVRVETPAKSSAQTSADVVKADEPAALEEVKEEVAKFYDHQIFIEIDALNEEVSITKLERGAPKPKGADVYVVVEGDTLWHIARRLTGNPFNYPKLAKSSRIKNPDLIYPNQKIYVKVIGG